MTENGDNHDKHSAIADAFGRTTDPLIDFDTKFKQIDVNPFDLFLEERIHSRDYAQDTVSSIELQVGQWVDFVEANYDRHPACPATRHVMDYARYRLEDRGNSPETVRRKLATLARAFYYFQEEPSFPHSTDFNPFKAAMGKINLADDDPQDPRPIPLHELKGFVQDEVRHIRDRAMIMCGFKLAMRVSEVSNIKVEDVQIANSEVQNHYDELGIAEPLNGRPNAIYIPHDRERNKRERPTVLPLDDEMRRAIRQWLLIRPDNGEPWLFLSKSNGLKIDHTNINDIWKKYFRPEYGPTDRFRGVSSHYGRHYFTTYLRIEKDWPRELIKYMRGDMVSGGEIRSTRDAIDSYIHSYYEDIENRYRREVFKFRV